MSRAQSLLTTYQAKHDDLRGEPKAMLRFSKITATWALAFTGIALSTACGSKTINAIGGPGGSGGGTSSSGPSSTGHSGTSVSVGVGGSPAGTSVSVSTGVGGSGGQAVSSVSTNVGVGGSMVSSSVGVGGAGPSCAHPPQPVGGEIDCGGSASAGTGQVQCAAILCDQQNNHFETDCDDSSCTCSYNNQVMCQCFFQNGDQGCGPMGKSCCPAGWPIP